MSNYTITGTSEEPLITLHPDGRVTVSDKYTPDETAAKVLAILARHRPSPVALDAAAILELEILADTLALRAGERDYSTQECISAMRSSKQIRALIAALAHLGETNETGRR